MQVTHTLTYTKDQSNLQAKKWRHTFWSWSYDLPNQRRKMFLGASFKYLPEWFWVTLLLLKLSLFVATEQDEIPRSLVNPSIWSYSRFVTWTWFCCKEPGNSHLILNGHMFSSSALSTGHLSFHLWISVSERRKLVSCVHSFEGSRVTSEVSN